MGDRLLGRLDVAPRSRSTAGAASQLDTAEVIVTELTASGATIHSHPTRHRRYRLADSLAPLLEGRQWVGVRVSSDLVATLLALLITFRWPHEPVRLSEGAVLLAFPGLVLGMLYVRGLYSPRMRASVLDGLSPLVGAVSVATMALVVIDLYAAGGALQTGVYPHLWAFALLLIGLGRLIGLALQHAARARGLIGTPTIIVGAGVVGRKLAARLQRDPQYGLRPVGFIDDEPLFAASGMIGVPVLGGAEELEEVSRRTGARHILFAFSSMTDRRLLPLVRRASAAGLEVSLVPRMFESVNDRLVYESLGGIPVLRLRGTDPRGVMFDVKHAFDRIGAALVLAAVAPVMGLLALTVRLSSPGPVVFRQRRVGRDGRVFDLLKFRSMRMAAEDDRFELTPGSAPGGVEGADRRTAVGRFMRRTSLDELPQLWNVVRGDMSLVGPRPERPEYAEQFRRDIERYGDRDRVKAGITGWAQVHGLRGQTSIEDRAEWDNYYIEHWSPWLDVKILLLTLRAMVSAE